MNGEMSRMQFGPAWYAVALSTDLEAGTSAGTHLFGKEIVLWRDRAGVSHAWEDRCPHRGMRLSFGFVRGNHIACLYHGWQYDEAGQCRSIPAHPGLEVPDTIRVATYSSVEQDGLIWVHSEMTAEAPAASLPDLQGMQPVRSLYVDRPAGYVAEFLQAEGLAADGSMLSTTIEGIDVRLALQPFDDERAALHILAAAGEGKAKAIAAWAEGLRHRLEGAPPLAAAPLSEARP